MAIDVARARLATQRLVPPYHAAPADVVRGLVAVQAQDYAAGLWAIGQRTAAATRADVERALADREIVRTWPMRGTLHIIARDDVRWITALLGVRVLKRAAYRHRQLDLDAKTFAKVRTLFEKHLAGGSLTRPELYAILTRAKIEPGEQRGPHILTTLAMEGLICFGAHRGKLPTFALLDEWIPTSRTLDGDEALAELARRYFQGHGPATVDDFAWWSGLNLTEARRAVEMVRTDLERVREQYWSGPLRSVRAGSAHLLSAWDELTVGYRDRSACVAAPYVTMSMNGLAWCVAVDGRVVGLWRRERGGVTVDPFAKLDAKQTKAIERARQRFVAFSC